MTNTSTQWRIALCGATLACIAGCSNMETPATANVAVSKEAITNANAAGGTEFAPVEMQTARQELASANTAITKKDYRAANDFANRAQADAKLAQGKANSAKAQQEADALQDDIRVLRVELDRANQQQ